MKHLHLLGLSILIAACTQSHRTAVPVPAQPSYTPLPTYTPLPSYTPYPTKPAPTSTPKPSPTTALTETPTITLLTRTESIRILKERGYLYATSASYPLLLGASLKAEIYMTHASGPWVCLLLSGDELIGYLFSFYDTSDAAIHDSLELTTTLNVAIQLNEALARFHAGDEEPVSFYYEGMYVEAKLSSDGDTVIVAVLDPRFAPK